jgi:hypothetical protein
MQVGKSREQRVFAPNETIGKISRFPSLGHHVIEGQSGDFRWELFIFIPLEVLYLDQFTTLKGKSLDANFYKCGDRLAKPHYLCWNPIEIRTPDFHRPEFFGTLIFK